MRDIESLVGTTLGRFKIIEKIGQGGMGVVFKARDGRLERDIALKILWPELSGDAKFVQRFSSEARAAAQLTHPCVVEIYGVGKAEGLHCIAMEHVQGRNLAEIIHESGSLPVPNALAIARGVASALAEAHKRGIVHRDIKPGNIMIDRQGRVRVLDFGLARVPGSQSAQTRTGSKMGTPAYMSPEQCGSNPVDARTDVYSLGVTLFELLAGQRPFSTSDPLAVMYQIVHDPCPRLGDVALGVPPLVEAVVHTMMAKEPEKRHPDGSAVASIFAALERGDEQSVRSIWPLLDPPQSGPGGRPAYLPAGMTGPAGRLKALIQSLPVPRWAVVVVGLLVVVPFLPYLLPRSGTRSGASSNVLSRERGAGRFVVSDINNPAASYGAGLSDMEMQLQRSGDADAAMRNSSPGSSRIQGTWDFSSSLNMLPAVCFLERLELSNGTCRFTGSLPQDRLGEVLGTGSYSVEGAWPGRIHLERDERSMLAAGGMPDDQIDQWLEMDNMGHSMFFQGPGEVAGLFVVDGDEIWLGLDLGENPPKSFREAAHVLHGARAR